MNTLTNDAGQLALDELTQLDLIDLAQHGECLVHIGVELGADVFAFEGHLRALAQLFAHADTCPFLGLFLNPNSGCFGY